MAARKSHAKHPKKKKGGKGRKGGKRGNPGTFKGSRLLFLVEEFSEYRKAAKKRKYSAFWRRVLALYWDKFPWWLPLDAEPEGDLVPLEMTDELLGQKDEVIKKLTKVGFP